MNTRRPIACALALLALALPPIAARADLLQISDMFVFGDSLSDGGNNRLITQAFGGVVFPPLPYADGRFSNGPTAVEQLWTLYNPGTSLQPSLAGGTNFAVAGATTGLENFNVLNGRVPPELQPAYAGFGTAWQLERFQEYAAANAVNPATSLFVVWLFPNDVFYASASGMLPSAVAPGLPATDDVVTNGIANIVATIQILAAAGAQHFLVPNMANLADTPASAGDPQADAVSIAFNTNLAAQLALLDAGLLTAEITLFDTDAFFGQVRADPASFGLTNTTGSCVDTLLAGGECNPDEWLFWDGVHPTTRAHQILAQHFRRALIAEPGTLVLLGLGLIVLAWIVRRSSN
jgi:phospholipase/lecithinase/hemolysin